MHDVALKYLNEDTKDSQTIRLRSGVGQVWVFDIGADKMDLSQRNDQEC